MKARHLVGCTLVMIALATSAGASTSGRTSLGLGLNVSNAPPPPVVVDQYEPRTIVVSGSSVYVVDDARSYDLFRYGVNWYIYNDGHWYRGRSHRGPFRVVEVRYVPRAVLSVPARHWKNHPGGPPGQLKRRDGVLMLKDRPGRGHR